MAPVLQQPFIAPPPIAAPVDGAGVAAPHTAPHDEIISVARELIRSSPSGGVTIDALANGLKGRGFRRTSGSPRLITRLRRIKELTLSRSGLITLVDRAEDGGDSSPAVATPPAHESGALAPADEAPARPERDEAAPSADEPATPTDQPRRRSRRGGRRRRGRGRMPEGAPTEPALP